MHEGIKCNMYGRPEMPHLTCVPLFNLSGVLFFDWVTSNDEYDMYLNITDDDISPVYVYVLCNILFVCFQCVAMNERRMFI